MRVRSQCQTLSFTSPMVTNGSPYPKGNQQLTELPLLDATGFVGKFDDGKPTEYVSQRLQTEPSS